MDLLERMQKMKEQEVEIKSDKKPVKLKKNLTEKKKLNPPPKPIKVKQPQVSDNFFIDLAQTSEFKRLVYRILYGKVHRTEKQHGNLDEKVKVGLEIFRDPNFSGSVKAMKEMFKNGFTKPSDIVKEQEKIKDESNNTMVDV